ncbi:MAG: dissimilatory-type sulfite reductase subunit alpha [Nitrospinae bacterium]|nr:dissimilatory-type sulfite reductase subunit alpha [Nitrospinota bacterium]
MDKNPKINAKTPMLDELEKGPWPSFVTEIKRAATDTPMAVDLLRQVEQSYNDRMGHWKHGGLVGVRGYGSGIIGRYSGKAEQFPEVAQFHTMRILPPAGWFYTSEALNELCDIWDKHGSKLTNLHGSTGDIILLGTKTDGLEPTFQALTHAGWDLGGSGSATRTPSCCVGPARCEMSCYDTLDVTEVITREFQDTIHRPAWPYKFKFKMSGCPNDCVSGIARSDFAIIGVWRDQIRIDQAALPEYTNIPGFDIKRDVCDLCPTKCIDWDGKTMKINDKECVHCMHCLNVMPKALRVGKEKGAAIMLGAKAPIVEGALMGSVIVPFMKMEPPYTEMKDLIQRIWDFWEEYGNNRERVGELVNRVGLANFVEAIGLEPNPYMVMHPRENPYVFYNVEEGED